MDVDDRVATEGSLTLTTEALANYGNDPVRLEMVAKLRAWNYSDQHDPPLGPATLATRPDRNRRAHELVLARLAELRRTEP